MSSPVYIFNPEHDLALANSDGNFMAPSSARKLAHDLSVIPLWYSDDNSTIISSVNNVWLDEIKSLFPQLRNKFIVSKPDFSEINSIHTWGWDKAVKKQLLNSGAPEMLVPNEPQLENIKKLSHRRKSIEALYYINENLSDNNLLDQLPIEINNINDAEKYAVTKRPAVFKAPWSGSGKGLSWVRGRLSDSHRGWIKNIIEKQGSVIAEHIYNVEQNFAMEFLCENGKVQFAGYSLFEAEKGIYRSNILMPDDVISDFLTARYLNPDLLQNTKTLLTKFIENEIAPFYSGALGIDMFVYEENGTMKLHPCVEINLRMTMGYVARIFYDNFVNPNTRGRFYIDHSPVSGELWSDHNSRTSDMPLKIMNGKIQSGYLSLSIVQPHSHYRVRVELGISDWGLVIGD